MESWSSTVTEVWQLDADDEAALAVVESEPARAEVDITATISIVTSGWTRDVVVEEERVESAALAIRDAALRAIVG